jgi:hypothetical protein
LRIPKTEKRVFILLLLSPVFCRQEEAAKKLSCVSARTNSNKVSLELNFVNTKCIRELKMDWAQMKMFRQNHMMSLRSFPAAIVLRGTDNGTGHAVSIYENYIVDASWPHALPRTMETLDWCCSPQV